MDTARITEILTDPVTLDLVGTDRCDGHTNAQDPGNQATLADWDLVR